jgi:hypothetical protein
MHAVVTNSHVVGQGRRFLSCWNYLEILHSSAKIFNLNGNFYLLLAKFTTSLYYVQRLVTRARRLVMQQHSRGLLSRPGLQKPEKPNSFSGAASFAALRDLRRSSMRNAIALYVSTIGTTRRPL